MKFTTLFALVATASAIKIEGPFDFNYDSTGGHASVVHDPTAAGSLNPVKRGTDDSGHATNAGNDGTPVIEKK